MAHTRPLPAGSQQLALARSSDSHVAIALLVDGGAVFCVAVEYARIVWHFVAENKSVFRLGEGGQKWENKRSAKGPPFIARVSRAQFTIIVL